MKKFFVVLIFAVLLLSLGCSVSENVDTNSEVESSSDVVANPSIESVDSDAQVVIAGHRNLAPGEKDAYYCNSILMVWEPLITKDESYAPKGKLVESYSANDDYTIWTFKLKENVTFHDGIAFNADAVIANFDRMKLGKKSSSFYTLDLNKTYPGLEQVNKVDDYTVELVFEKSLPTLDYSMTDFGSPMFSPANFDEAGDFNGLPMGTGPFKLTENVLDEYCVLERNDGYYGEKAKIKSIKVRVISDPDTRFAALKAEEIMGVIDLGAIQPIMGKELLKDDRFSDSVTPSTITHNLIVNGNKAPFSDVRMRQAVSLLIDRQLIVDSFYAGVGKPTANFLNQCTPFEKPYEVKQDLEEAKRLAKEVIGKEKMSIKLILRQGEIDRFPNKEEAELLQAQLKSIGLEAEIIILENGSWSEAMKQGDFDICIKVLGMATTEPNTLFKKVMLTDYSLNKNWSIGYSDAKTDALISAVDSELDMNERIAIYDELQAIGAEQLPIIPLFHDMTYIVYNKKIENYEASYYGVTLDKLEWSK